MKEKILTISIAAYNAEKWLRKCVDSLLIDEIKESLDIIIVDDGSKDKTSKIGEAYQKEFPGIVRCICKENGGHGSTINTSITYAKGKYYKVVDSDDWCDKEGLIALVDFLKNTDVDMVFTNFHIVNPSNEITGSIKAFSNEFSEYENILHFENIADYLNDSIPMHAVTYKTSILKEMNERIQEKCFYVDVEYVIYPLKYVDTVVALDRYVYMYLMGTDEQSVNYKNMVQRRAQHRKVTEALVSFYAKYKDDFSIKKKTTIQKRILSMIRMQYLLYFLSKENQKPLEIQSFDLKLKSISIELYQKSVDNCIDSNKKISILIRFFRIFNYAGFPLVMDVLHKMGFFAY